MSRSSESTTTGGGERNVHIYFLFPRAFSQALFLSSVLGLLSPVLRSSRSFPLFLRSSSFSRRSSSSSSRYSRSGILKPPCRNKTGLWPTRASAWLVAFQKYNVSTGMSNPPHIYPPIAFMMRRMY